MIYVFKSCLQHSLEAPRVQVLYMYISYIRARSLAVRGSKKETVFGLEPLFVTIINYSELAWGWEIVNGVLNI